MSGKYGTSGYPVRMNRELFDVLLSLDARILDELNIEVVDMTPTIAAPPPMLKVGERPVVVVPNREDTPRNRAERRRMKHGKAK